METELASRIELGVAGYLPAGIWQHVHHAALRAPGPEGVAEVSVDVRPQLSFARWPPLR